MKEKNKKLIIVVASLLVVVGVSFAFFTASVFFGGEGANVSGTTATIGGSELKVEGILSFNDLDIYPGHENVSSIKVTAIGENEFIPYNIIWEGINTLNTSLNYTVYKTNTSMNVSASCDKRQDVVDGALRYYEECSISNIDQLGSMIASGTIHTNETKVTLIPDEFITSSEEGEEVYYYVVLEYPNIDENQNSDIGGTFTGKVTIEENDASPDITIIGIYIEENGEYKEINNIPSEGYELNTAKSTCSNNTTVGWDSSNNRVYVENLNTSGTECTLYYDEVTLLLREEILANNQINNGTPDFSQTATTDEGMYAAEDDLGTSYYFRGAVPDNYVKFAGYYWRVVRINGDGSIRLIYDGTNAHTNGESSADRKTGAFAYNSSSNASYYVGYTYQTNVQRPIIQNSGTASTVKGILDNWYTINITNKGLDSKVVSTPGFCNDRNLQNGSGNWVASGTTQYYAVYERVYTTHQPTLQCSNTNDLYTVKVGLITTDEVMFAGGTTSVNSGYYLYIGQPYLTLSPCCFDAVNSYASVFNVNSAGNLNWAEVNVTFSVRPVINLSADVTISSGNGTMNNPYVVN